MKIRLLDIDSLIPNFALMKISSFYKNKGDNVDWYNQITDYRDTDKLYISKVFTFSKDFDGILPENGITYRGGTGYDLSTKLPEEIENTQELDYSLYPKCDYSIIFTTRGCIRKCPFCVVPQKEGKLHNVIPTKLNPKGKYIMLLDNNFFSNVDWKSRLEILKSYNQPIDFNTGIDLRTLKEEQCCELSKLKIKTIHTAWDNYEDKDLILSKLAMLCKYIKPYKIMVYVLVGFVNKEIVETDIERVETLRNYGVDPFAMGYIDFNNIHYKKSSSVKKFCRWVNRKWLFKSVSWEQYNKGEIK